MSTRRNMPRAVRAEDRQVWTNVNTGEVMPDVMTPTSCPSDIDLARAPARATMTHDADRVGCSPAA